jgi:hypothetical protein
VSTFFLKTYQKKPLLLPDVGWEKASVPTIFSVLGRRFVDYLVSSSIWQSVLTENIQWFSTDGKT